MKTPFKLLSLSIAGCLLASYSSSVLAAPAAAVPVSAPAVVSASVPANASHIQVKPNATQEHTSEYTADLSVPVIEGMKDTAYQTKLNNDISASALKELEDLKAKAHEDAANSKQSGYEFHPYELYVSYEVKTNSSGVLSIKMSTYVFTGGAHGLTRIDTYNVSDRSQADAIELKALFGDQYKSIINERIQADIAKDPGKYFSEPFKGIADDQTFYIENGEAVIVFSQYEIAPYASGSPEFRIAIPAEAGLTDSLIRVTSKKVQQETDEYTADLSIPVISGLKDKQYEAKFNDLLEQTAMKDLDSIASQAKEGAADAKQNGYEFRPYDITVTYEIKSDGGSANNDRFSLKLSTYVYTGGAHGGTRIDTYNVSDKETASSIGLKDLFGDKYQDVINPIIQAEIAKAPENYFADAFKGITDTQTFYIENGEAVIVFGQYEIAPYAAGAPEFRIAVPGGQPGSAKPTKAAANGQEFALVTGSDDVAMAPLRGIAEALGYTVTWYDQYQRAELIRGNQLAVITVGEDKYAADKADPAALGAAPYISQEGSLLVPASFFTEILKASSTEENGTITLSLQ
ncbi:Anti-sigma-V factor RsiV [Paenibacillus konkukensis]|uniref:Anti-sigma-V factor RsiV n=1 Tax=Paenibacillus konkukensis TaxID=2020716 RepID=A0ABY4RXT1_9BACL|nr:DUF4163 domain-containing protein [Paenibacillus konkukensis]UQZ87117.1 Anti-sigma-V factor RsiV [Paenibacillus konkukensis]